MVIVDICDGEGCWEIIWGGIGVNWILVVGCIFVIKCLWLICDLFVVGKRGICKDCRASNIGIIVKVEISFYGRVDDYLYIGGIVVLCIGVED